MPKNDSGFYSPQFGRAYSGARKEAYTPKFGNAYRDAANAARPDFVGGYAAAARAARPDFVGRYAAAAKDARPKFGNAYRDAAKSAYTYSNALKDAYRPFDNKGDFFGYAKPGEGAPYRYSRRSPRTR